TITNHGDHQSLYACAASGAAASAAGAASPPLNFFLSTPWPMTTATSRPTAFITVTKRCDGALMRNKSFEYSSSFEGMVASALISFGVATLPSTTPPFTLNCSALSATYLLMALASATGSPVV